MKGMTMNHYRERDRSKVYIDTNSSGLEPVEDKLLLLPDMVSESVGMIYKPERALAMEQMAQVRALLIAIGGNCFENWGDPIPELFTRVMVCKFAGIQDILGADGLRYQLCTDRDITALITEDVEDEEVLTKRRPLGKTDFTNVREGKGVIIS
jgi:hypothetical protein